MEDQDIYSEDDPLLADSDIPRPLLLPQPDAEPAEDKHAGSMQQLSNEYIQMSYYLATPPPNTESTNEESSKEEKESKAIVLATDLFGLGSDNPRIVADAIAASTGLDVYVPDIFQGKYIPQEKFSKVNEIEEPVNKKGVMARASFIMNSVTSTAGIGIKYLKEHSMDKMVPWMVLFCDELRRMKKIKRLGLVGYSFGGHIATLMASNRTSPIDVFVAVTPSGLIAVRDFQAIKFPFALILAQEDLLFDPIKKNSILELQALPNIPTSVHEHPGTVGGFGMRPKTQKPKLKLEYKVAIKETAAWFNEHL